MQGIFFILQMIGLHIYRPHSEDSDIMYFSPHTMDPIHGQIHNDKGTVMDHRYGGSEHSLLKTQNIGKQLSSVGGYEIFTPHNHS